MCLTLRPHGLVGHQVPLSMGFSRQEYWRGLLCPSPGDRSDSVILYQLSHQRSPIILEWVAYPFSSRSSKPGIELGSPALQADSLPAELPGKHWWRRAEANVEIVIQNIYLGNGYFHVCRLKSECLSGGSGVPRDKRKIHFITPSLCINLSIQAGPTATLSHCHYIPANSCSPPWNIPTQHPNTILPLNRVQLLSSLLREGRNPVFIHYQHSTWHLLSP